MKNKYLITTLCLMLISIASLCQNVADTVPPYKKNLHFPEFKVVTPDSVWITNANLPADKPLVLIYFSPDCVHCQFEAKEIYKNIEKFKDVTFLWVSYHPLSELKEFRSQYKLEGLPNVIVARDPKYFLPSFYQVAFTPYIAVYNSGKVFVKEFREGAQPEELIKSLQ